MNFTDIASISKVSNPFRTDMAQSMQRAVSTFGSETSSVEGTHSFKSVLGNVVHNVNETLNTPDALMKEAMTTGNVDVHDVMVANAKSELLLNVTTQIATKVIQAYDRILQIQI
jgi:flagellar hook-basal body complex protein FliE